MTIKKTSSQAREPSQVHSACGGCSVLREMVEWQKQEIMRLQASCDQMQNKILAMAPPVIEGYQRLQLTQMAHLRPTQSSGVMPRDDIMLDPEQEAADFIMNSAMGMGRPS